jgi:6-phosphogluconolactonase (cycloisomerase 2 family)
MDSDFPNILATPAQVQFTPQADQLVVTVKDALSAANNSIWVFPVDKDDDYLPADMPIIFQTGGPAPFGFTFDFFGRLFVTDAGVNTVTSYRVEDDSVEMIGAPAETGQMATCWIVATRPYSRYVYAANTGSGTLSGYRVKFDGTLTPVGLFTVKEGALNIDTAVSRDGRYLYTQNGGLGTVSIFRVRRNGALELMEEVDVTDPMSGFQGIVAW